VENRVLVAAERSEAAIGYYRPCGDVVDQERFQGAKENARYGGPDADPMTWRTGADEVVVAMDAETGKTVWKKVFADEGINIQSGKDAGISNHTMCYADGRVYALGTMGRVYCLAAKTGELIWRGTNGATEGLEAKKAAALKAGKMADKKGHSHEHGRGTSGLIVAGGVLIVPMGTHGGGGLRGLDGVTGRVLWQLNESVRGSAATPSRWVHDGGEYVIVANAQGHVTCINPIDGKVVWRVEDAGANFSSLAVGSDYLIAKPHKETVADPVTGEKKESVDGPLGCYRLGPRGAGLLWKLPFADYQWNEQPPAITNGHVYARVKSDVGEAKPGNARGVCIELSTGRVKGEFTAPFGGADCCTIVADGRVLADADGSHNDTQLYLADANPAQIKSLGGSVPWRPPHVTTTAYHPAMTHAYVAGRVFIRGQNHICCYDVRRDPHEEIGDASDRARFRCDPLAELAPGHQEATGL